MGVKLANPELNVIAVGGDGDGFAIGAGHFPHAARRNIDITYLVMDNEIYGLTKGQVSPTSLTDQKAPSTPWGNLETPLNTLAFAVASGAGYHFKGQPMNPQFWLRYDFASGDNNPNDGKYNTFNQLFPFGNYYLGWADRVGRQNIHDFNAQLNLHPMHWATFTAQYHRFYLANKRDFLYNAAGNATLRDITGQSGSYVGDEIDFRFNIHVDRHQDVLVGYSKLFAGDFLKARAPGVNPSLFYVQYNIRF